MLICEYCGTIKEEEIFVIGASREPDWCMIEGTGKMACPVCYVHASNEGQAAIQKHVEAINQRIKKSDDIKKRLEYLRGEIEAERISYGEIAELQALAKFIEPGDALLLEWASILEY